MGRGKQISARARARRRRADRTQGDKWSAVKASSTLIRTRDEVLSRSANNPFVSAMARGLLADTYSRYTERFIEEGADEWDAKRIALTAMAHSSGLSPEDPQLFEQLQSQKHTRELAPLRVGEAYVISPAMHATVMAAAETLTAQNVAGWRSEDLLSEHGILLLPHIQLVHDKQKTAPEEIVMLSWSIGSYTSPLDGETSKVLYQTAWYDSNGPIEVPEFTAAKNTAARSGHPLPSFGVASSCRHELDISHERIELAQGSLTDWISGVAAEKESDSITVGEHAGDVVHVDDLIGWQARYLFAFMGLAQQRIATVQRFRETRADGAKPAQYDDVRVVQLRSFSPIGDVEQTGAERQYHHRWIVRMHKVNQWYPSEGVHKIIWRGPYIKGPTDAPLLPGEKVNALIR